MFYTRAFKPILIGFVLSFLLTSCGNKESSSASNESSSVDIAKKYEGELISQQPANRPGIEDGLYLVKNGKKIWIANSAWLKKNGYADKKTQIISSTEFNLIPKDPSYLE
jgi:hypothetical protein